VSPTTSKKSEFTGNNELSKLADNLNKAYKSGELAKILDLPLSEFNSKAVMTKDLKKVQNVGDDKRAQFVHWEDRDKKEEPPTSNPTGLIIGLVLCGLLMIVGGY